MTENQPKKVIDLDDIPGMTPERKAALEAMPTPERGVVHNVDFRGDPTRKLGFPGNENPEAMATFIDRMHENRRAQEAGIAEAAVRAAHNPDIISRVPFSEGTQQMPQGETPAQPVITEIPQFKK